MKYSNIIATLSFVLGIITLIFTWRKEKKKRKPIIKVYMQEKVTTNKEYFFSIENIGNVGVIILSCKINEFDISECAALAENNIIGALINPHCRIQSLFFMSQSTSRKYRPIGALIKIKYKSDFGKTYEQEFTLNIEK